MVPCLPARKEGVGFFYYRVLDIMLSILYAVISFNT